MTDEFGACVVAIPEDTGLPIEVDGGPHITLGYFGDEPLPNEYAKELLNIVRSLADSYSGSLAADVRNIRYFGENKDVVVLTLDETFESPFVHLRDRMLDEMSEPLRKIFDSAQTFSRYRPHLTLGYKEEGYVLPDDARFPKIIKVRALAFWNGAQRIEVDLAEPSEISHGYSPEAQALSELKELYHYGTPRHSGRYPWGSGENPYQSGRDFLAIVDELHRAGMSQAEIARNLGITTTQLRARKSIEKSAERQAQAAEAMRLKAKQMSNVAIGERMGIGESQVRRLLDPALKDRRDILENTSNLLRDQIAEKKVIDIGLGNEIHLGISKEKLATAAAILEEEGYRIHTMQIDNVGTTGNEKTLIKVLAAPGIEYKDIAADMSQIQYLQGYSEDDGRSFLGIEPPKSVDSKRVGVRYAEEGGADMDGVIQLRRGVDDISLGNSQYAQVRVMVDDTHYLKGMAMYGDDLPEGVDMMFNTNKAKKDIGTNKLDAMKALKDDPDNPFGSTIRQKHYIDSKGKRHLSPLNIVGSEDPEGKKFPGEEGAWGLWSKKFSSQMLSKQNKSLAEEQLNLTYEIKKDEYEEIMSLTNPAVKKKLLESFADGADSSAVHLKAASLPRTANHVILPINSLKDNEIYAPNYRPGERVALIRHPHGGIFEIPELTVTDKNPEARSVMRNAKDAVGINSRVAARLSGADFDGDTVLVIPNNSGKVKSSAPLQGLKDFDPQARYPGYEGMKPMSSKGTQLQMGDISNLITDMTIKGATNSEIAAAVRHSMVVIDAEKHKLDYRQSAKDNDIRALKKKYQATSDGSTGASTIISRASSQARVPERRLRRASDGGPIDPKTGEIVYTYTNATYVDKSGKTVPRKVMSNKMMEVKDAKSLVSETGTPMELVYATHANRMKGLANDARKASLSVEKTEWSPSAKKAYAPEVDSLRAKLNTAKKNKPLERQSQVVANTIIDAKRRANPDMDGSEIKKIKGQALRTARERTGAYKQRIQITPKEWEAIQSGAVSNNLLDQILNNTDLDLVKKYATPRTAGPLLTPGKMARANSMLASGYTQAEVAAALGVSVSTLNNAIQGGA